MKLASVLLAYNVKILYVGLAHVRGIIDRTWKMNPGNFWPV